MLASGACAKHQKTQGSFCSGCGLRCAHCALQCTCIKQGDCMRVPSMCRVKRHAAPTAKSGPCSKLPSCSGPEPKTPTCRRAAASVRDTILSGSPGTGTGCHGCCQASGIFTLIGTCMYLHQAERLEDPSLDTYQLELDGSRQRGWQQLRALRC